MIRDGRKFHPHHLLQDAVELESSIDEKTPRGVKIFERPSTAEFTKTAIFAFELELAAIESRQWPALKLGNKVGGGAMDWKKMLAYISGSVDEKLLLISETSISSPRIESCGLRSRDG